MGKVFSAYGTPPMAVSLFQYLGKMLSSSDNNWTSVERNLRREQGKWVRSTKILGRKGADMRMAERFYVAVMQKVLLFWSKTWVMTPRLDKTLKGFHHPVDRRMVSMVPNINRMQHGCTHSLGRCWKWWGWRRSGYISPATRTRSHNTL